MNTCKLIFRNVCKNIRDYLIYFLTLTLSVSLFYAFNSISDQPAFSNMGMTGTLLYRQLGIMLSTLSTMIAVVLAFLILYANQFLLKRRKKELGVYMMLGMKKGRISRLFAGETLCVGIIALGTGLLLGFFFSQGFSLIALRLFAINLEKFRIVFSAGALRQTVLCFTIIFFIVMLFNIRSVTNVKLIDLLTDGRKNESMQTENRILPVCLFLLSLLCIGISAALFNKNGILPSHENNLFQLAAAALVAGTFLLFYSLSAVFMQAASARKCFYLKGLNTFLVRQIGSKIRTNYLVVTVVCGLLTITICAVSIGASTALAMHWEHYFNHICTSYNKLYREQLPNITPHVCRHTFCSNMAKSGMNPKTLQYLMGHSDIGVTLNTYTHVQYDDVETEMKRVVNAE